MPLGLVRSGDYRHGSPVSLPVTFGQPVTLPVSFGHVVATPLSVGNSVTWTPTPNHFGNAVTLP
jgi:hypothetical protein